MNDGQQGDRDNHPSIWAFLLQDWSKIREGEKELGAGGTAEDGRAGDDDGDNA